MKKISLSIVIPAYNEEKRVGKTIRGILEYLIKKKWDYELIVVDDGSKDETVKVVKTIIDKNKNKHIKLIMNNKNRGKGHSVKRGVLNSHKELILFSDADLSTPIEMVERFIPFIENNEIIIGSRLEKGAKIKIKQPFYRRIPGKIFPLIVRILILNGIKDTQCGFKMFKKETAKILFSKQKLNGFSFDAEILYLAKKLKYPIKEVPVIWINELDSKLNPIKDSFKMFIELLKIKLNDLEGLYK